MNAHARKRLRLAFRDCAALCAMGPLALSGTVPSWVLAIFGLSLALSFLGVRLFEKLPTYVPTGSLLLFLGGLIFLWQTGMDPVIAAASFASIAAAHLMAMEHSSRRDGQLSLVSLLMVSGGAALSGEVWFAGFLILFALFSALNLGLETIDGSSVSHDLPIGSALQSISFGFIIAVVGAIAFFIFFPRLSWNIAGRRTGPSIGEPVSGMTDSVRLGGSGAIKSNPRVVARIRLSPDPKAKTLDAYWFGRAFDKFDGKEWRSTSRLVRSETALSLKGTKSNSIRQEIETTPAYGSRAALALERPIRFMNASASSLRGLTRVDFQKFGDDEVRFSQDAASYQYIASSSFDPDSEIEKVDAKNSELPELIDPRVKTLAESIAKGETDPQKLARAFESHLQSNFSYSVELNGDSPNPLSDFLFVKKSGHCEDFATALAVLLRVRGHSARVVGGFFGGQRAGDRYVLRARDAHAWVQVFVKGKGWVSFDATPASGRGGQAEGFLEFLAGQYEELEALWRTKVLDYSFQDQFMAARNLVKPPASREKIKFAPSQSTTLFGLLAVALLALWYFRRSLRWAPLHPATRYLNKLEKALEERNVSRGANENIEQLSLRLKKLGHPLAQVVEHAVRLYTSSRFGALPLDSKRSKMALREIQRGDRQHR